MSDESETLVVHIGDKVNMQEEWTQKKTLFPWRPLSRVRNYPGEIVLDKFGRGEIQFSGGNRRITLATDDGRDEYEIQARFVFPGNAQNEYSSTLVRTFQKIE